MNRGAIDEISALDPVGRRRQGRPHGLGHGRGVRTVSRVLRRSLRFEAPSRPRQPRRLLRRHVRGRRTVRGRRPGRSVRGPRHDHSRSGDADRSPQQHWSGSTMSPPPRRATVCRCSCSVTIMSGVRCSKSRQARYFGINPDDSDRLIELAARRPAFAGYFAGHTHRNRVRRFPATGDKPWVEVACVKDFPGSWAEYRVFDGGVMQVHRRISTDDALAWTEKTRGMFDGAYPDYAFGNARRPQLHRLTSITACRRGRVRRGARPPDRRSRP